MPSKKVKRKALPMPFIDLNALLKPEKPLRSTSTASNVEPVMDGIMTSSGIEPPFELDDPKHDPIFAKFDATTVNAASCERAQAQGEKENSSGEDMDISDDDASSTESEDSSVDISVSRQPKALSKVPERSKGQEKPTLPPQSEKKAAGGKGAPPSSTDEQATNTLRKGVEPVSRETIIQPEPQERANTPPPSDKDKESTTIEVETSTRKENVEQNRKTSKSSDEGPPRKRLRTDTDEAFSKSSSENKENASMQQLPWSTGIGETRRPRFDDEEEQRLFDKIDNMILEDEWEELKQKIEDDILQAEEADLMKRVDLSIQIAEEAMKPGGRVHYTAQVLQDGSLKEEYTPLSEDPLLRDKEPPRKRKIDTISNSFEDGKSLVLEVEDLLKEVSRKAKLPKYEPNTGVRLITRESLHEKVIGPILAKEGRYTHQRRLVVLLNDDPNDPFSVFIQCQGHPDLVKEVEGRVTSLIRAAQPAPTPEAAPEPTPLIPQKDYRQSEKQQRGYSSYISFLDSYKDVLDIEFKGSGINVNIARKHMWESHKDKFGQTCGDNCPCARDLPYLTNNVVSSVISSKLRKDPTWKNNLRPSVGFVDSFSRKFFSKLEAEHPDETPKQILARLVLMWRKHEGVRRFGTTCSNECPCREGWDQIFTRGRLLDSEREDKSKAKRSISPQQPTAMKIPRRRPSNENMSSSTKSGSQSGASVAAKDTASSHGAVSARIPRRPSNEHSRASPTGAPQSLLLSNLAPPIVENKPNSARIPRRRLSTEPTIRSFSTGKPENAMATGKSATPRSSSKAKFQMIFQPGEALGFYVKTPKGTPACKVTSLSDSVKRKEPKLQVGAVITDVTHGNGPMQRVRTYMDLKQQYDRAKKDGKPMRLRFTNPAATLLQNKPSPQAPGEWTPSGDWVGTASDGWAGGARCISAKDYQAEQSRKIEPIHPPLQQSRGAVTPAVQLPAQSSKRHLPSMPCIETLNTMRPAKHREIKPTKSILRKSVDRSVKATSDALRKGKSMFKAMAGEGPTRKSKLKFSDPCTFEERYYDKGSLSFLMKRQVASEQAPGGTVSDNSVPRKPAEPPKVLCTKDLIDAIRKKGFRDVISVLEGGVSPTERDDTGKSPKEYVKERLEELKFERDLDPTNSKLASERKDFELKRKVLSIYIDAISTIDRARYKRNWERLNLNVDRIKNVCLTVEGEEHPGSRVLECRAFIKGEEMPPLPLIPIEGTIMHDWKNDQSTRGSYSFNYNPHLLDPNRSNAVISLFKGDRQVDARPPILLGEAVIPLSRISTAIAEKEKRIEKELPPNEFLASCEISMVPKKLEANEVRKSKAAEATAKLKDVIAWIHQFNKETKVDGNDVGALSGHITAPRCGISLLHAAIYLDEPGLAKQLIDLGANPSAPSHVGSASLLATNLLGERNEDQKASELLNLLRGHSSNRGRDIFDGADAIVSTGGDQQKSDPNSTIRVPNSALAETIQDPQSESIGISTVTGSCAANTKAPVADNRPPSIKSQPNEVDTAVTSSEPIVPLPVFDYWCTQGEEVCHYFRRGNGCNRGRQCRYLHVCPPIGPTLDNEQQINGDFRLLDSRNCIRKSSQNSEGRVLHTAAYCDPEDFTLYIAEGGPLIGTSNEGICWYNTEDEAIAALERVVAFHKPTDHSIYGPQSSGSKRLNDDRNDSRKKPSDHDIYGPQSSGSKRPRDDRNNTRQASGNAKRSKQNSGSHRNGSVFDRISRQPNLSLVHSNIFDRPLRKTDWIVRKNNEGEVTATLVCPMDRTKLYQPTEKGGGRWSDGAFWFKNLRDAKASAFNALIESCIKFGIVNADATKNERGKPICL